MFMCIQPALPVQPAPRGVFRQYELRGLGWGAAAGPWLLHAPVVERWAGLAARGVWWQGVDCMCQGHGAGTPCFGCNAELRKGQFGQLNAGRKPSNQEKGSLMHIQICRHSHCMHNAIHTSESFCFTLNWSWEGIFTQLSLTTYLIIIRRLNLRLDV